MQVDEYGSPNWARWVGHGGLLCGGKIPCRSLGSGHRTPSEISAYFRLEKYIL